MINFSLVSSILLLINCNYYYYYTKFTIFYYYYYYCKKVINTITITITYYPMSGLDRDSKYTWQEDHYTSTSKASIEGELNNRLCNTLHGLIYGKGYPSPSLRISPPPHPLLGMIKIIIIIQLKKTKYRNSLIFCSFKFRS